MSKRVAIVVSARTIATSMYEPTGTQFNVFPVSLPNGGIGLDWTFYENTSPDTFRGHFGTSPTARTFVLPHQISETARNAVDTAASRLLPGPAAELIHRTTMRTAAPIVDIAPPERMVATIGDSPAVMVGDALATVRPHTARSANNGIDQASAWPRRSPSTASTEPSWRRH